MIIKHMVGESVIGGIERIVMGFSPSHILLLVKGLLKHWTACLLVDLKMHGTGEQELISPEDSEGYENRNTFSGFIYLNMKNKKDLFVTEMIGKCM